MRSTHPRARRSRRATCLAVAVAMLAALLPAGAAVADHGEPRGRTADSYAPRMDVRRDQMASFIARFVETASGQDLPEGDADRFDDVADDNVHRDNIAKLAEVEIVLGRDADRYDPKAPVSRGAMAAFIARAISYLHNGDAQDQSRPPAADEERFDDVDDDYVHYDAIEALAAQHVVVGFADGDYRPHQPVRRDQMASFVMRGYDYAVHAGLVVSPLLVAAAFTVDPDGSASLPQDGDAERRYTADVGDADEVILQLTPAHLVDVDGDVVRFAHIDGVAEFGDVDAEFTEVRTGGTVVVGAEGENRAEVPEVAGGEVVFDIASEEFEEVVPVVYVPDEDGDLRVDGGGVPLEDTFAVGGATLFADVDGDLRVSPEVAERRVGSGHSVTVALVAADDADVVVPLPDDEIEFEVSRYDEDQAGGAECPAFGEAEEEDLVDEPTGAITIGPDGTATLAYGAPDEEAHDCIAFQWEGSGDHAGQDAEGTAYVTYSDDESEVATVSLDPVLRFADVGVNQTVTATVLDQYDAPMEDVEVDFELEREGGADHSFSEETDAQGRATVSFSAPTSSDRDEITATAEGVDSPTGEIVYVVDAGEEDVEDATVLGADLDAGEIYVQEEGGLIGDDGDYLRFRLANADELHLDGDRVARMEWEASLAAMLDDDGAEPELTTDNHRQSGTTVYDLDDASGPLPIL